MQIDALLKRMIKEGASDGFISAGAPPSIKVDGTIYRVAEQSLSEEEAKELVLSLMRKDQREEFFNTHESNYAVERPELGRFRISAFVQRGHFGMVLRRIETAIPSLESLSLPPVIAELAMAKRGLVILVGATGTGKSTTMAGMIGHRNQHSRGHIISIEDPIEYMHQHAGCIITQREVGMDTESFDVALRNALRQAPDVIVIGEIRTAKAMAQAMEFAETGHLCLCTLHANNANQALDRIQSFFPASQHSQIWMDLSMNLKAMVAQQLLPRNDGKGRHPIVEVMLNTPLIADYIRKGEIHLIKELMAKSGELGMRTLDQSLVQCYQEGIVSMEDAMRYADSANEVRLMIKMQSPNSLANEGAQLTYDQN